MSFFAHPPLSMPGVLALAITALIAAYFDATSWRIPNALVLGSAVAAVMLAVFGYASLSAGNALLGGMVGIALLLPMYLRGGMGAGDVKLLGALGMHAGPWLVLHIALASGFVGGVWAAVLLFVRSPTGMLIRERALLHLNVNSQAQASDWRNKREPSMKEGSRGTLPYGVVIAAGTLVVLASIRM